MNLNILNKLGITKQSVYSNFHGKREYYESWLFWDRCVWPTYSDMLEGFVQRALYYDKNGVPNRDQEKLIKEATGLTLEEIKKRLR